MEIILVTLIAGIGGAIFGAYCTYLGAIKISQTTERQQANLKFYGIMICPVVALEKDPASWPYHVIAGCAHNHLLAAKEFRYHLREKERRLFDKAWQAFFGVPSSGDAELDYPRQYVHMDDSKRDEIRGIFMKNIHTVLSFTGYQS